jgi:hypothetical protein
MRRTRRSAGIWILEEKRNIFKIGQRYGSETRKRIDSKMGRKHEMQTFFYPQETADSN